MTVSIGRNYQAQCKVCSWTGSITICQTAAEEEGAEHAGYCSRSKVGTSEDESEWGFVCLGCGKPTSDNGCHHCGSDKRRPA